MKKLLKLLYSTCLSVFFLLLINKPLTAHAADVYLDSDNNFCVQTEDQIKTSSIWYKTRGFDVSRCVYDPASKTLHETKESFMFLIDETQTETVNIGGIQTNIFKIPLTTLMAKASGEWQKEVSDALEGGKPVYIRFDAIMVIYHGNRMQPGVYRNYAAIDGTNPAAIINAEAWRNPSGLNSHYNRYFMIGSNKDKPKEEITEDEANTKISEETSPLEYATGNASPDGYDLGEGIPSSKDVTNSYFASSWYGSTEVWARTVTTDKYTNIPYRFTWQLEKEQLKIDPDTGKPYVDPDTGLATGETEIVYIDQSPFTGTFDERINGTTSMVPAVAFNYLANADFYDLSVTGSYNMAYPSTIYYDSTINVPMSAITTNKYVDIATEVEGANEIESWFADTDLHVTWGELSRATREEDLGSFKSEAEAKEAMKEKFVAIKEEMQETVFSGTITKNDYLMIDGREYLKVYDGTGVNWTDDGEIPAWTFCTESAAMKEKYVVGSIRNASVPRDEGTETVTIPRETDNGKYPTGLEVTYTRKIQFDGKAKIFYADSAGEWFSTKENYEPLNPTHCLDPYNGYINVHTPVIAPVTILDDKGQEIDNKTQVVDDAFNEEASYQLLLDENYVLDWENEVHRNIPLYGDSGKYSKYDEFVEKKWMCFPFDVEYNGKYYDAYEHTASDIGDDSDSWNISGKYTDWILIETPDTWDADVNFIEGSDANGWEPHSDNHWRQTPIYIPSYADEVGRRGEDPAFIYYKVEAINSDGRYGGDHTSEQEAIYNKNYTYEYADDGAKYVATYKFEVQLSGIIYDFTITGSSDKDTYLYEPNTNGRIEAEHIAFCMYKMEKHVGKLNRYGETALRYRTDGEITHDWKDKDTLPLTEGRSNTFEGMGYVMKGSRFSYSFKTIANLWSEGTDYVEITPTFRYVRHDGTVTDNIKIYYNPRTSKDVFVEYGSSQSMSAENTESVQLIHTEFDDSYYDELNDWIYAGKTKDYQIGNWLNYTVNKHNRLTGDDLTVEEMMWRKTPCFNLSKIVLNSDLRLLSGEWEQLKRNTKGNGREFAGILRYSDKTYTEDNLETGETEEGLKNWSDEKQDKFKKSMQTWYGQYYVPAELFIVDLDDPDTQDLIRDYGLDPDPDTFDLMEYMNKVIEKDSTPGIREDDPIFERDGGAGGYLIINFDIRTYNEGKPHLQYYGMNEGSRDMWKTEGFDYTVDVGDFEENEHPVDLKSGDVAIVDLAYSVKDKYKAAIFNIN